MGCPNPDSMYFGTTVPKHDSDVIWTNNGNEPEWIDPGKCGESAGSTLVNTLFAGLAQPHPQSLKPMPDIATGWDISTDGLTYTFYLRQTQWSDGHPFTAEDFEWSWKRVLDPKTDSRYANFLWTIKNGEAFNRKAIAITKLPEKTTKEQLKKYLGATVDIERIDIQDDGQTAFIYVKPPQEKNKIIDKINSTPFKSTLIRAQITNSSFVGVKALDNYTLEATLENPIPYFLDVVMFYTTMPVPKHVLDRLEQEGTKKELWTRPENIVSNGAYKEEIELEELLGNSSLNLHQKKI